MSAGQGANPAVSSMPGEERRETAPSAEMESNGASRALGELMEQRMQLEARLLDFDAVLKELKAARLPATLAPAMARMRRGVEGLDADLTRLADVVHDLCAELEGRALPGEGAPRIEPLIFVRAGEQTLAVRVSDVEEIRAWHEEAARAGCKIISLREALGMAPAPTTGNERLLVLPDTLCSDVARNVSTSAPSALLVDEIIRQDEVVVRGPGSSLEQMKFYSGVASGPRGELVLVLNTRELVSARG